MNSFSNFVIICLLSVISSTHVHSAEHYLYHVKNFTKEQQEIIDEAKAIENYYKNAQVFGKYENQLPWPSVKFPYNGVANATVFQFNNVTQELTTYKNLTSMIYIDSDGNRGIVEIKVDLPTVGSQTIDFYIDYTKGVVVNSIQSISYCVEQNVGLQINLKGIIDAISDQNANYTQYLGKVNIPWFPVEEYHQFHIQVDTPQGLKGIMAFFTTDSQELRWVTLDLDYETIIGFENGIVERKFTDDDYKNILRTCPNTLAYVQTYKNEQFLKKAIEKFLNQKIE
ncbi:UNKNOWN [Stylonychia lemnae]|uniref:Uncharacterized protein n=1 Tax=Stylonychia lemnae TaxID=5949 RepID=A0A078A7B7_STYLE|nr:UNKNOWN [Stylonychia lemnae]|eukprot:CDW77771.1 UNKNOWN [Stylonychia lemnae]